MARCEVKVIEDSIYNGSRLTTLELEYPLYIHAEFMTHRVFSRNAQSNRAIPVDRLIERIQNNKWYPIWVENQPGMAASKIVDDLDKLKELQYIWDLAKSDAILSARELSDSGIHKQIVNRLLSPYQTIKVIVSATDWNNFFRLRIHPAAQQEIQELAIAIRDCMLDSDPIELDLTEWHLPYVTRGERDNYPIEALIKLSTARCARVSYLNHNSQRVIEEDLRLHDLLKQEKHMSPLEHSATPYPHKFAGGNFKYWRQYRYYVEQGFDVT